MSKNYKTFKKEKWLYFALSIVAYFLPFIITTACLLPVAEVSGGFKASIGLVIIIVNAMPFLMGIFKSFFAHFPMLNVLAIVFLFLGAFFMTDFFQKYAETFLWIELSAAAGSIVSCVLWGKHRKYARFSESVKAAVASGAFERKEDSK